MVASKMEEDYDKFSHSMEDIDAQIREAEMDKQAESRALMLPAEARRLKLLRQCRSLYALAQDEAASKGERNVPCKLSRTTRRNSTTTPCLSR